MQASGQRPKWCARLALRLSIRSCQAQSQAKPFVTHFPLDRCACDRGLCSKPSKSFVSVTVHHYLLADEQPESLPARSH
ncbi:hypothetical protein Micbo1qcDRAFT_159201, partial [Microdochium bolleyi]